MRTVSSVVIREFTESTELAKQALLNKLLNSDEQQGNSVNQETATIVTRTQGYSPVLL